MKPFQVNQKLDQIERVRAQLLTSANLTVIERLTLYHSVDAGLRPGMIVQQLDASAGTGRGRGRAPGPNRVVAGSYYPKTGKGCWAEILHSTARGLCRGRC